MAIVSIDLSPEYLRRVNAALALREVPDYESALHQLNQAVEKAPEEVSVLLLLGLTLQDLGDLPEAEQNLRKANRIEPDSIEVLQALGLLLLEQENYEEATSILESLIKANVHDASIAEGLATALNRQRRRPEAIVVLEEAHSHFPDDPDLISQLGRLLLRDKRYKEAEEILREATEIGPNSDNLLDLAVAKMRQAKHQQALTILEEAIRLSPKDDRLWRTKTVCLLKLKDTQKAVQNAEVTLSLDDENPRNWALFAQSQYALDQYDEALATLEKAIEVSNAVPDRKGLWLILMERAIIALESFEISKAIDFIRRDLAHLPKHKGLRHLLIDLLISNSQYADALAILEETSSMGVALKDIDWEYFHIYYALDRPKDAWAQLPPQPSNAEDYENYLLRLEMTALKLYQGNKVFAAKDIFKKVVDIEPTRARSLNNLGFILIGEGQREQAEEHVEQARDILKGEQENRSMTLDVVLTNLGYIYLRQQKPELAVQVFEKALDVVLNNDLAILRIAYWLGDEFSFNDEDRFPTKSTDTVLNIQANLSTAYFLSEDHDRSINIAQSLIDSYPESTVGYRIMDCIHFSLDDRINAQKAWEEAWERSDSSSEQSTIRSWLDKIPS